VRGFMVIGLGQQVWFFVVAWVLSPFTALLALRLVRRWRPSMGKLRRALSAILLVSAFNVGFGLLISEPSYLPPLAVLLFGPASAPFAVGLVRLLQRLG
jgi:hypothetical protein